MPRVLSPREFACESCGMVFTRKADLHRHERTHSDDVENLKCACPYEGCYYRTLQKSNLKTHIIARHLKEKPHKCQFPECPSSYADGAALIRHERAKHGLMRNGLSRSLKLRPKDPFVFTGDIRGLNGLERIYEDELPPGMRVKEEEDEILIGDDIDDGDIDIDFDQDEAAGIHIPHSFRNAYPNPREDGYFSSSPSSCNSANSGTPSLSLSSGSASGSGSSLSLGSGYMTLPSPSTSSLSSSASPALDRDSDGAKSVRLPPIKTMFPEIFSPGDAALGRGRERGRERSAPLIQGGVMRGGKAPSESLSPELPSMPDYFSKDRFHLHRHASNADTPSDFASPLATPTPFSASSNGSNPRLPACYPSGSNSFHGDSYNSNDGNRDDEAKRLAKSMSHLRVSLGAQFRARSNPVKYPSYSGDPRASSYASEDSDNDEAQYREGHRNGDGVRPLALGRHASAGPGVAVGTYMKHKPSMPPLRTNLQPANWAT